MDKSSGVSRVLDTRVANLRFNYNKDLVLDERQRFDNPLGFQVVSYRVDTELVSMPVQPLSGSREGAAEAGTVPSSLGAPSSATGGTPARMGEGHDETGESVVRGGLNR